MQLRNIEAEAHLFDTIVEVDDPTREYNSGMTPMDNDDLSGPAMNQDQGDKFNLTPDMTGRTELESQIQMLVGSQKKSQDEIDTIKKAIRLLGGKLDGIAQSLQAVTKPGLLKKLFGNGNGHNNGNGHAPDNGHTPKPDRFRS